MVKSKSPSRKTCQVNKQSKEYIYIVYITSVYEDTEESEYVYLSDYAGFFKSKDDAVQVAKCLNNIYSNIHDPIYKLYKPYDVLRNTIYYSVSATYTNRKITKPKQWVTDELMEITPSLSQARNIYNELHTEYADDKSTTVHMTRYYLNDIMPTMHLRDYDAGKHKEHMEIIMNELPKHIHGKKMADALYNIDLLKWAPPSKVLPKGGLGYRKLVNDPEFKKRWSKYDKSIK